MFIVYAHNGGCLLAKGVCMPEISRTFPVCLSSFPVTVSSANPLMT